ncbi:GNAT family N-acetyltransferase [Faucicola boevrei]|uniref:GNAT family N-acetyltransferase n=1 Tax=Faucicola boevrei TaxID=346665 RepID=UPI00036BAB77|nr:GNAT family N-acetyltransferase [Moraxella boevrei]
MPLEALAIRQFDALQHNQTYKIDISENELQQRLIALYQDYPTENGSHNAQNNKENNAENGEAIFAILQKSVQKNPNNLLFLGLFNGKPIACIGCFDDGLTDNRRLQYLTVHPANRGRGIAKKFLKQVISQLKKQGIHQFSPSDTATHHILQQYEWI